MVEGITSIIYAAPRTELKGRCIHPHVVRIVVDNPSTLSELLVLREILMHKYGREFSISVLENRDGCVTERVRKVFEIIPHDVPVSTLCSQVTNKLTVATPPRELVDAYLGEIAKGYGVDWSPPGAPNCNNQDDGGEGGVKVSDSSPLTSIRQPTTQSSGRKDPEKVKVLEAPLHADATTISAEARSAGVRTPKLPDLPPTESGGSSNDEPKKETVKPAPPEDDFSALAKRFEALKKR